MTQDRAHLPLPAQPTSRDLHPDSMSRNERANQVPGGTYFLGRYRVVDEIGVGGMASVHLARMDGPGGFQKWIAVKRIHPHLVEDETFVNMFFDEARVAARISHPNVATVFELGKHENTYWIAMEYLHGEPLREMMRRTEELGRPVPPEIACRVVGDAAEGLHAAHELRGTAGEKLGLVHRDVTPHNLFVTYDGTTKVVDFGIAKFSSRMAHTRAGTLKGKVAYMSPEQVTGEALDRRTDVFALGVVLWELTTGLRLFRMDSDLDTLAKVQQCTVPRPSSLVRGYPLDLERIVLKALAKAKGDRFDTARELSRALQSVLMRRGLFVGSDEISGYMASIFRDRIQKREAHLRWAAEVTKTIDIGRIGGDLPSSRWLAENGSLRTANSEIQPSQPATLRPTPRPAAGMPARLHPAGSTRSALSERPPRDPLPSFSDEVPTLAETHRIATDSFLDSLSFDLDLSEVGDTVVDAIPSNEAPPAFLSPPPTTAQPLSTDTHGLAAAHTQDERGQRPTPAAGSPPTARATAPSAAHGPAEMQRLFAPPQADDQRTVTAQARKRQASPWAVAAGSTALGLLAAALVVLASRASRVRSRAAGAPPAPEATVPGLAPPLAASGSTSSPRRGEPSSTGVPLAPETSATSLSTTAPSGSHERRSATPAPKGSLRIICYPACSDVIDNGASLGPSPIVHHGAVVGLHRVRLVWSGASKTITATVIADRAQTLRVARP